MKQKHLSKWLMAAILAVAMIGAVVYGIIIPSYGVSLRTQYPEFSNRFYPWLIFLTSTAVPCYTILVMGWLVAVNIGKDRSFSGANARYLKIISILSAALSVYFFVGNGILLCVNMSHPGVMIFSLLFVLAGFAVSVAAAVLSHLVSKAAAIQAENDWTV